MTVATGRPKGGARTPDIEDRRRRIELYEPHAGQLKLHNSKARFRIACCGRRFGKTYACINETAKFAWEHPGNATEHVSWWCAPTYNQALKAMNVFLIFFKDAIASHRSAVGQMSITWKNGSVTCFQSTERYDNLRGEGVEFMVLDEAAMMPKAAWEKVLRPMLTDTNGSAVLISTPRGKNWFYVMYKRGEDEAWPSYESFSFPTSDSPFITAAEIEEVRSTLPEDVFAQEYLGAFLDEAAGVFHNVEGCIHGEFEPYDPLHRYVIGWDIAKSQDWSVVTVFDCDKYGVAEGGSELIRPHVVHWERFNMLRYDIQIEKVSQIARQYGAYILLDSTGVGDPIYDMLQSKGVPCAPYIFTNRSKQQLIQNLQISLQTNSITYPEIPVLLQELNAYQYSVSEAGAMKYSAPEGDYDDCVISLALGAWAALHPAWNREPIVVMEDDEEISPI